eukprot:scaffold15938_cov21-Tisochrysis_lutea.AAC.1
MRTAPHSRMSKTRTGGITGAMEEVVVAELPPQWQGAVPDSVRALKLEGVVHVTMKLMHITEPVHHKYLMPAMAYASLLCDCRRSWCRRSRSRERVGGRGGGVAVKRERSASADRAALRDAGEDAVREHSRRRRGEAGVAAVKREP